MNFAASKWAIVPVAGALMVGVLALALQWVHNAPGKKKKLPPFNRESMFVTLSRFMDGTAPDMLVENARTIGNVYRLNLPGLARWFVVCDAELAKTILENHHEKPDIYKTFEKINPVESSMFTKRTHGENWDSVRKNMARAFSMTVLTSTMPQFDDKLKRLVHLLEEAARNGQSVDIVTILQHFTFDFITCSMLDMEPAQRRLFTSWNLHSKNIF